MQNSARSFILHFAFCILHFDYRSPREMTIFFNVSRTPGSVEWHLRFPRMQNAKFGAQSHFAFCILHSAFCILTTAPLAKSRSPPTSPDTPRASVGSLRRSDNDARRQDHR